MSRPKRPVPRGAPPDLRAWLDQHAEGSAERLSLTRSETHLLWQELSQLRQSNDRLRKQNRKIRRRYLALRGDDGELDAPEDLEDLADDDRPDEARGSDPD